MLGIMLLAGWSWCTSPTRTAARRSPHAPWVGDAMRKGVQLLPTLDNQGESRAPPTRRSARSRPDPPGPIDPAGPGLRPPADGEVAAAPAAAQVTGPVMG